MTPTSIQSSDSPAESLPALEKLRPLKEIKIGNLTIDPPIFQAPMAGFTNYAFRQIVREYGGVGLQATEMINASGFVWRHKEDEPQSQRIWGIEKEARPLAVQIWDNEPDAMAQVGKQLAKDYGVSVVDINFGCPVKRVTKGAKSGSYLLSDPPHMGRIISAVVKACSPTPVTAKIRLGCHPSNINANEIAKVVEQSGAAALTVHGRTAADMFRGQADWDRISEIKQYLKEIPLIGNGDLDSPEKVVHAYNHYNVDGLMIARACLGRPWLFQQCLCALTGKPIPPDPTMNMQRDCMLKHYKLIVDLFCEKKATVLMRKYACCYATGKPGAREFRCKVANVVTPEEFYSIVDNYFPTDERISRLAEQNPR